MKDTGVVRNMDALNRLCVPKEILTKLDISKNDAMNIFVNGDTIVLKKYEPGCCFCGTVDDGNTVFKKKQVCKSCIDYLKGLLI
jgi:transcriptional pleiotropic regulator of transition state genes